MYRGVPNKGQGAISHVCGRDKTVDSSTCGPSGGEGFMSRGFDHDNHWAHPNVRDIYLSWAVGNVTRPIGPPFFCRLHILQVIVFVSAQQFPLLFYFLIYTFFSSFSPVMSGGGCSSQHI